MLTQTMAIIDIIRGRPSGWSTQRREADGTTIRDAVFAYRWHVAMGVLCLAPVMTGATIDFWMLPIIAGLLLAPVTATLTSRRDLGDWLASNGIFTAEGRSEEHTSELQSLMRISYAVFCLKKKKIELTHETYMINSVMPPQSPSY